MASRDTRLEIDLGALAHNARVVKNALRPDVGLLAAVKADAYGHGMIPAARAFLSAGADALGVAMAEEGAALRAAGIRCDILIFGPTNPEGARCAVANDLIQAAYSPQVVEWMQRAAEELDRPARIHIKVETGMNRIGVSPQAGIGALLEALGRSGRVRTEGIFTHLAASVEDAEYTRRQNAHFAGAVDEARRALGPLIVHAANSGAILLRPELQYDMVRGGILLYGYPPCHTALSLRPAMSFVTNIAHLHTVEAGDTIGYGRSFTAPHLMRIATLPVGYGDGYPRCIGNRGHVLVGGQKAPVVGRVCMDQCMVDVTHVPDARVGDPVVLWGGMGEESLWADQVADWCGTIPYEALLYPGKRVPRRYRHG